MKELQVNTAGFDVWIFLRIQFGLTGGRVERVFDSCLCAKLHIFEVQKNNNAPNFRVTLRAGLPTIPNPRPASHPTATKRDRGLPGHRINFLHHADSTFVRSRLQDRCCESCLTARVAGEATAGDIDSG